MTYKLTDLNSWPVTDNGQPILKSTNEAMFYAQLIYDRGDYQHVLSGYRALIYRQLKAMRESENPDLDYMMGLAVKAQFCRECLEECQRIKDEKFNTPGV